jgi:hypothetical protein
MQTLKKCFCKPAFQAFVTGLVLLMFSWPIITILEPMRSGEVFYYFFTAWGLVIFFLLLIAISHRQLDSEIASESESKD